MKTKIADLDTLLMLFGQWTANLEEEKGGE